MADWFEYRVCQAQHSKITYVNGVWQGRQGAGAELNELDSCPFIWAYLNEAGAQGWELVSVTALKLDGDGTPSLEKLYLRRRG